MPTSARRKGIKRPMAMPKARPSAIPGNCARVFTTMVSYMAPCSMPFSSSRVGINVETPYPAPLRATVKRIAPIVVDSKAGENNLEVSAKLLDNDWGCSASPSLSETCTPSVSPTSFRDRPLTSAMCLHTSVAAAGCPCKSSHLGDSGINGRRNAVQIAGQAHAATNHRHPKYGMTCIANKHVTNCPRGQKNAILKRLKPRVSNGRNSEKSA
mmetsp:Transcript_19052/g.34474  ORF Transcript_19052/g.34474 Transcript_19052/m.34474 type:complete len:212 (-) Transcript_19052:525-1160(-)